MSINWFAVWVYAGVMVGVFLLLTFLQALWVAAYGASTTFDTFCRFLIGAMLAGKLARD